ncbi:amino acid adenylation domain-containing protein [Stappia sp.]|uniref:amino acid adenylation domain-containing protein n=1 Tax=Stappia sp. TaxID=1870903 RepID=UPI003A98D793
MTRTMPRLLEEMASFDPDAPAVVMGETRWTRAELDRRSNDLASRLAGQGVRRGDRVGIYLDKSPEAVAALLAVLKADAICVPLDPTGPVPRLAHILGDCEPKALVSSANKVARLTALLEEGVSVPPVLLVGEGTGEGSDPRLCLVAAGSPEDTEPAPLPQRALDRDLAYILYTSGSTGRPKGVMISHGNITAFSDWAGWKFGLTAQDRVSAHAPLHFDLSLFDVWTVLAHGAAVHLVPQGIAFMAVDLVEFIADNRITVWQSVPSVLRLIARQLPEDGTRHDALRLIFFAGEPYPPADLRDLMSKLPQALYFNVYGATEFNDVTCHPVTALPGDGPLPIGAPCEHMEALVLGEDGALLEDAGSVGELCARGPTVSKGYWRDPQMTAARFIQDPRHDLYPDPVYRTGDLVRIGEDGTFHYVGRRDTQVKIRGFRVNIGEVETALLRHEAIGEAAVVDEMDGEGTRYLAAFLVARGSDLDTRKLKRHCLGFVPNYMVPERFELLEALPKTSTGKIDRQALRARLDAPAQAERATA